MIDLLTHISIECVEQEIDSQQSVDEVSQMPGIELIQEIHIDRSKCITCDVVLTEEDIVKNHGDNNLCRMCTYKTVLNM